MTETKDKRELGLFRFFTRQKVFVNLVAIFVLVVGSYIAYNMKREAFPNIDFDLVMVTTVYPGAVAQEVEQLVTIPLERELKGVDGIDQMDSVSLEGRSQIILKLDPNVEDKRKTVKDIENAVERIRVSDLPEDGNEPLVQEITSDTPVLIVGVSGSLPEIELREITRQIQKDLENIPGVGQIPRTGYRDREIWVETDLSTLNKNNLSLIDLVHSVRQGNHTSPGGTLEIGGEEILVRSLGKLETPQDVGKVVVRSNAEGYRLLVEDVADIGETLEREREFSRINGQKAIRLTVTKRASGDALKIAQEVRAICAQWQKRLPEGTQITFSNDISFYIQRRLDVLMNNGIQGMILVLVVLFFFLSTASAFWTVMAIPLAYLGGMIVMHLMGYTINMLSMFSFVLVSGMLVDDGIVITEYIERKREEGLSPFRAAVVGVSQMALPITAAVATTLVAFAPLAFTSGIMGKFLRVFPIVITAILVVDLIECLFILPSHLAYYSKLHFRLPERLENLRKQGPRLIHWLEMRYRTLVTWCVDHAPKTLGLILLLFIFMLGLSKAFLKFHLFPVGADEFVVSIEMPVGTSLKSTEKTVAEFEKLLSTIPAQEQSALLSNIGFSGDEEDPGNIERGVNRGQIRVLLDVTGKRKRDGTEILNEFRPKLEHLAQELGVVSLAMKKRTGGPPTGQPVEVHIIGEEYPILQEIAEKTQSYLKSQKGVFGVKDNFEIGKQELRAVIDRTATARAGVPISNIALSLRSAFDGETATSLQRPGVEEEIDVQVKLKEPYRETRDSLEKIQLSSRNGTLVPLSKLVRFEEDRGILVINRTNNKRTISITADIDRETTTAGQANGNLDHYLKDLLDNYPGYSYEFFGEEKDSADSVKSLMESMVVCLLVIYMLLATLFQSFARPLILMAVIPFAFVGTFITLLIHGEPLSIVTLVGMTGLMGVVVNNSILIVDTIDRLAKERPDLSLRDIFIEAPIERLRPIFITSISTFFGILPLGYGLGGKEPFLQPPALTFGWGLMFTSIITLFLIPSLCAWTQQMSEKINQFLEKRRST